MARVAGPVWIVQPEAGEAPPGTGDHPDNTLPTPEPPVDPDYGVSEGAHPDHTLPGDLPHVEHPIVLPPDTGEDGDHIWGGGNEPFPTPPIVIPDPGDGPKPSHPIVLPGDPEWGDDLKPTHPIVIPPPDGGGSTEPAGELSFYQRKTLGINWDSSFDECAVVSVQAGTTSDDLITVRTVLNDGTSSVTYPQDFTGQVLLRVVGKDGYCEGTATVK